MESIGRAPVLKDDLEFVEDRTNSMLGRRRLVEFLLNISISNSSFVKITMHPVTNEIAIRVPISLLFDQIKIS